MPNLPQCIEYLEYYLPVILGPRTEFKDWHSNIIVVGTSGRARECVVSCVPCIASHGLASGLVVVVVVVVWFDVQYCHFAIYVSYI